MPLLPWPPTLDLAHQAREIYVSQKQGESGIWMQETFPVKSLVEGQPRTLYEIVETACNNKPSEAVFLTRPLLTPATSTTPAIYSPNPTPISYSTLQSRRLNLGKGIICLAQDGLLSPKTSATNKTPPNAWPEEIPGGGFAVGIWSHNRPEWQIVDFAAQAFSLVGVALYDTLGPNVVEYITNHSPLSIVFSASSHLPSLLKIAPRCPTLRVIVSMDKLEGKERSVLEKWGESVGVKVFDMHEIENLGEVEGRKRGVEVKIPSPETVATISYTSGTTGNPKGVVLTHGQFTSGVVMQCHGSIMGSLNQKPRMISYLPLAHIFERFMELLIIHAEGEIAYSTGDPLRLLEDCQVMKPNAMPSVPRVLNRIHQAVMAQKNAGGLKGALLSRALDTKIEQFRKTGEVKNLLYDALVFRKVRALLGGNIAFIGTGSAPISAEVLETLKACFSCEVVEGYGMTETIGTVTSGIGNDPGMLGTTGAPRIGVQVKLVDVPELNYTSKDKPYPRGEIWVKGPHVFERYHKNEKATQEALTPDRWLRTGDIGLIDSAGRLKIVDRVKNVIKLSQGEYIALEKVEGVYALSPLFTTVWVHGDSLRASLILVGVVDPLQAATLINKIHGTNLSANDVDAIKKYLSDKKVVDAVLNGLKDTAKKAGLTGFETVRGVHLQIEPFPEDLLTPTLKIKRQIAAKHYKKIIDALYNEIEGPLPGSSSTSSSGAEPVMAKL